MKTIARRGFIKSASAAAIATAMYSCGFFSNPITQEEYDKIFQAIKARGLKIDDDHSKFQKSATTLITFLPDYHIEDYAAMQRLRIEKLDKAISYDIIGLEGIVGKIDIEATGVLIQKYKRFIDENSVSLLPEHEPKYEDTVPSDSDIKKFEKLLTNLEIVLYGKKGFIETGLVQRDLQMHKKDIPYNGDFSKLKPTTTGSTRYGSLLNLEVGLLDLRQFIPRKEGYIRQQVGPIADYVAMKQFKGSKPRITAPGLFYIGIQTKAKLLGIESFDEDQKANELGDACQLQIGISWLRQQLDKVCEEYEKTKKAYSNIGTQEERERFQRFEKTFAEYTKFFGNYIRQIELYREQLLKQFSIPLKQAVLDCRYDLESRQEIKSPEYNRLIVVARSNQWVQNSKKHRNVMLIGGKGHTDSVYQSALEKDCSIISLDFLEN